MEVKILEAVSLFAIFQAFIWILYLGFLDKGNLQQRQVLMALFSTFCVFVLGSNLLVYGEGLIAYKVSHLLSLSIFLLMPLFYLFIWLKKKKTKLQKGTICLHMLPFTFILTYQTYLFFVIDNPLNDYDQYSKALILLFHFQNIVYIVLISKLFHVPLLSYKSFFKSKRGLNGDALTGIVFISFAVIVILNLGVFITWDIFRNLEYCVFISTIFFLVAFILINFLILYSLIKQGQLVDVERYQGSTLDPSKIESSLAFLKVNMEVDKLYLDPLISLEKLAKKQGVTAKFLSQVINKKFEMNFNELINTYRIRDAQSYLGDPAQDMKILNVAYELGFSSKSTFNTSFKSIVGQTPSEFRKHSRTKEKPGMA